MIPPNTNPVMRDHITVDEAQAAKITGLTAATLAKLRRNKKGPETIKSPFTGEARYHVWNLHQWLESREVQ